MFRIDFCILCIYHRCSLECSLRRVLCRHHWIGHIRVGIGNSLNLMCNWDSLAYRRYIGLHFCRIQGSILSIEKLIRNCSTLQYILCIRSKNWLKLVGNILLSRIYRWLLLLTNRSFYRMNTNCNFLSSSHCKCQEKLWRTHFRWVLTHKSNLYRRLADLLSTPYTLPCTWHIYTHPQSSNTHHDR